MRILAREGRGHRFLLRLRDSKSGRFRPLGGDYGKGLGHDAKEMKTIRAPLQTADIPVVEIAARF